MNSVPQLKQPKNKATPLQFPCLFTFKAILKNTPSAVTTATNLVQQTVPLKQAELRLHFSSNQKYISISLPAYLDNQHQLTEIYQNLKSHKEVLMTL